MAADVWSFKDAQIDLQGRKFVGIDRAAFKHEIGRVGEGELDFGCQEDLDAFLREWAPGAEFEVTQTLQDERGQASSLIYKACRAYGLDGLKLRFKFLATEFSQEIALTIQPQTCECGSGSNVRGPAHSSYCRLLEV